MSLTYALAGIERPLPLNMEDLNIQAGSVLGIVSILRRLRLYEF